MALTALPTAPSYAADSPLAVLLDLAAQAAGPSEDEQRDDAQTTAAHHIYQAYPHTFAAVLEVLDWQGYPAWTDDTGRRFEPSAVAWLDGGLWLHHTLHISETNGAHDVLTLIVPCTCGRGYVDIHLDTEDALIDILDELRPTHGHSPHQVSQHPSRSRPSPPDPLTAPTPPSPQGGRRPAHQAVPAAQPTALFIAYTDLLTNPAEIDQCGSQTLLLSATTLT